MSFAPPANPVARRAALLALLGATLLWLPGCTSLAFGASDSSLNDEIEEAQDALEALQAVEVPVVQRVSTPFALTTPFKADFTWMQEEVTDFFAESGTLTELLYLVADYVPSVNFAIFLEDDPNITLIEFNGTVGDLIRYIASRYNLDFQPGPDRLVWRDQLVRVFDVSHLSGDRSFLLGRSGGGGGGGGGAETISSVDQQFATTQSSGNFWDELQQQLEAIVGGDGTVAVSNSSTLVTVRAPVALMRQVEDFFESLNRQLTVQIAIDVRLVQVNLFTEFQFGVDWNLIQQEAGACALGAPVGPGANCIGITTSDGLQDRQLGIGVADASGNTPFSAHVVDNSTTNPVQALVELLQRQGSTKLLTNPRAVTLNNQASQISLTTRTSYVRSVSTEVTQEGDAANVATLEPGAIETGFSLICLPKVTPDGQIILDVSTRIASLVQLENFGTDQQQLQLPTLNESRFFHRARIRSGETLVLGGIRELGVVGDGGLLPFRRGSRRDRSERILLITPRLL